MISIYPCHRNPNIWETPNKFVPERFFTKGTTDIDEELKKQVIPFSAGVRVCPGRNLAQLEILITLANLLRDYDFELPSDSLFGPDVIDPSTGEPKMMPIVLEVALVPQYPDRDCMIRIKHSTI